MHSHFRALFLLSIISGVAVLMAAKFAAPAYALDLTAPWWNGTDCDQPHHSGSYLLTSTKYFNLEACGPRPTYDNAPDVLVSSGGFSAYEWWCVELSMRYLYLAYGVPTYHLPNGGRDMVTAYKANYPNGPLVGINNGTVGQAPKPGDVMAYGTSGAGHTAVVIGSSVDGNGNGSITVLQENTGNGAVFAEQVSSWSVSADGGLPVTAWLHYPTANPTPTPPSNPVIPPALVSRTGDPAAQNNSGGGLEIFPIMADTSIYHMWTNAPASDNWSGWVQVPNGSGFIGEPTVAKNSQGYEEVFARTSNGNIWHVWQDPNSATGWSNWTNMAPTLNFAGNISVARKPNNLLEAFARGTDSRIWHIWQDPTSGTGWSGWQPIDGMTFSGDPSATINSNGNVEVFAVDNSSGTPWHAWQDPTSGTGWSGWQLLGGTGFTGTPAAVQTSNGFIYVFARKTDGSLWSIHQDTTSGTGWGSWVQNGGNLAGDPGAVPTGNTGVEVFIRDTSGNILYQWTPNFGGGWNPWSLLGSGFGGDPMVMVDSIGRTELFVLRSPSTGFGHIYQDPNSSTGWGNWASL